MVLGMILTAMPAVDAIRNVVAAPAGFVHYTAHPHPPATGAGLALTAGGSAVAEIS
jgi:hypothetical protein